jgi:hypothetical protein
MSDTIPVTPMLPPPDPRVSCYYCGSRQGVVARLEQAPKCETCRARW